MPHKDPKARRLYSIEYRQRNKERLRKAKRSYYLKHREQKIAQQHGVWIRYKYGLTPERYNELLAQQNHLCAICHQPQKCRNGSKVRLAVDHEHNTGTVRGLLCTRCNFRMGWFDQFRREVLTYVGGAS